MSRGSQCGEPSPYRALRLCFKKARHYGLDSLYWATLIRRLAVCLFMPKAAFCFSLQNEFLTLHPQIRHIRAFERVHTYAKTFYCRKLENAA